MRFEVVVEILLKIQRYYASFVNRILKNTFKKKNSCERKMDITDQYIHAQL
jgi:hypothetical protein